MVMGKVMATVTIVVHAVHQGWLYPPSEPPEAVEECTQAGASVTSFASARAEIG